jgi:hypothetical protein
MGSYDYDPDLFYEPEPEITTQDIADAVGQAINARMAEHQLEQAASLSEYNVRKADEALEAKYGDWHNLRDQVIERMGDQGYSLYGFPSALEAEHTLEFFAQQIAAEIRSQRAQEAAEAPAKEWDRIKKEGGRPTDALWKGGL